MPTYADGAASLRRACFVQSFRGSVAPFCGLFALLFELLEARYVLVGEVEAVGREGGCEDELTDGCAGGNDGRHIEMLVLVRWLWCGLYMRLGYRACDEGKRHSY